MADELRIQRQCKQELTSIVKEMSDLLREYVGSIIKANPKTNNRLTILLAAVLKTTESSRVILRIADFDAPDEMNVLHRTMTELVVNAAYLQLASDEELNRFLHHDAISSRIAMVDFSNATEGTAEFDLDLAFRIKTSASKAQEVSGLGLNQRQWSSETKTLKQRADTVDVAMDNKYFAALIASTYTIGSGYTHGAYKTLHKHALFLTTGREDPLSNMFEVCNSMFGVGYALWVFGQYISFSFNLPIERFDELNIQSNQIAAYSLEDLRIHRRTQAVEKEEADGANHP